MVLFVIFILSAVLLGVGTMLAPALPTAQPRIGFASSLTLIFVLTGSILWTQLVQWDTLVIDYLLFGVVSLVVLGGTMMQAQEQREDDSEAPDPVLWLSRSDFAFLTVLGIACIALIWTPIFPTDLEPITVNSVQTITDLPHFGAKAFTTLTAYLAQQLRQDSIVVQQAIISVNLFLCVFTVYDIGTEIKNTHLGKILAVSTLVILAVSIATIANSSLLLPNIMLALTALLFTVRMMKQRHPFDAFAIILLLAIAILF